ncbi:hypothetical protein PFFVO_01125, partial [Plasmodium falciparum Vietnam Oak-Knoll (FVO)]
MPTTDTITTTKILNHKYGLIGDIFSYEELKFIYFENKVNQMNRKVYDNLYIFKSITMSADVSRRRIDFYFPFFFENTTNVCLYVNNKLLPPNSRLYMTEEEAKNVKIKSYKHDNMNNKILCSNVSSKIDCTKTNMIRPLINLVYRKINRKQKVRFWEKYEERKKKNVKDNNNSIDYNANVDVISLKNEQMEMRNLNGFNDKKKDIETMNNEEIHIEEKHRTTDNINYLKSCEVKQNTEKENHELIQKLNNYRNKKLEKKMNDSILSVNLCESVDSTTNRNDSYHANSSKYTEMLLNT